MLPSMLAAEQVLAQALALPEKERWNLVSRLMHSLEGESEASAEITGDAEWRAAWAETIRCRLRSMNDGTVEMLDGDDVLAEMHSLAAEPLAEMHVLAADAPAPDLVTSCPNGGRD